MKLKTLVLLLLFPVWTGMAYAQTTAGDITVQAEGVGTSKNDALLKSKRDAVEKGIGTFLISETEIKNYELQKDVILTKTMGAVKHYDILEEKQQGPKDFFVRIQAVVALADIKADLAALKILLESMDKPRMMVVIQEQDGKIAENTIIDYLRQKGFGAQGGHPLGGLVLYPPLAVTAGLGWMGRHGLLITPGFGPRQRIAAIFTSIENLPIAENNPHSWISDFCDKCGRCIRTCPPKAIREHPVIHKSGRETHIIREKCLPVFVNQEGCTVCVKECTFSRSRYDDIHKSFRPAHENSAPEKQVEL